MTVNLMGWYLKRMRPQSAEIPKGWDPKGMGETPKGLGPKRAQTHRLKFVLGSFTIKVSLQSVLLLQFDSSLMKYIHIK